MARAPRTWAPVLPVWETLAQRQAEDIRFRYGYRAEAHGSRVLIAQSEFDHLEAAVMTDPTLSAVGRGWYLNGNRNMVVTPDWQWNHARIALIRLFVLTIYRPMVRPVLRRLAQSATVTAHPILTGLAVSAVLFLAGIGASALVWAVSGA